MTTASSLNSIGTIGTGTWAGTAITTAYGGHGAIPAVSKGDILVGAGNTWYNFPYSASNDQVLTVDTTLPFGLKWATPSASASSVSVAASAGSTVLFLTSTNNSTGGGLALSTVTTLSYNTVANTLSSTGVTATYVRALQYIIPTGGNNIAWYASDGTTQLMGINTSNGWLRSYQTTNATSTTSASLVSSGGLSVATNAMIGGTATIFSTTSATGISSGAFNVVGGASINGNAFIGGTTNITSLSASGTTASGALVISGGAGIGGSVNIGKSLNLWNPAYTFSTNLASGAVTATTNYILPIAFPSGTGTSYLSASTTGVMAWVAAPTGGGGTPGGSNKQIQYNNSSSFGGAGGFEFTTAGIANTVSIFSTTGTGYTVGMWVSAIGGTTRVGIGLSNPQFELEINGELSATNKSFVINHPTKPGMKLRYGSLEGPENGVYVRGELNGSNIIEVPDHWIGLVHEDSYTVHLTPIERYSQLYVEKIENYNVYIADNFMNPIHCYYSVWAERKDIPKLVTEY